VVGGWIAEAARRINVLGFKPTFIGKRLGILNWPDAPKTVAPIRFVDDILVVPRLKRSRGHLMKQKRGAKISGFVTRNELESLYIIPSHVQPGDVLLSRGTGEDSQLICKLTKGPFSHAALFLTQITLLESCEDGIGITHLPLKCIENDGQTVHLRKLADIDVAILLRHPRLEGVSSSILRELTDAIGEVAVPFLGMRYPASYELVSALPKWHPLKLFANAFKKQIKQVMPPQDLEGPFCSYLVALALTKLKIPLFDTPVAAEEIHPNRFLNSKLKKVDGGVTCAISSQEGNTQSVMIFEENAGHYPTRSERMKGDRSMLQGIEISKLNLKKLDQLESELKKLGQFEYEFQTLIDSLSGPPKATGKG
jgi:hypothetical protein